MSNYTQQIFVWGLAGAEVPCPAGPLEPTVVTSCSGTRTEQTVLAECLLAFNDAHCALSLYCAVLSNHSFRQHLDGL